MQQPFRLPAAIFLLGGAAVLCWIALDERSGDAVVEGRALSNVLHFVKRRGPDGGGMRARLRVKSERRVGIHAISEVSTRYALEFDRQSEALSVKAEALLTDIAKLLMEDETVRISVEGHTDDEGEAEENERLSIARAEAVATYLGEKEGVESKRLVTHGFGAALPLEDNATDEGRARNRRVQFLVMPDVYPSNT